ncbi:MAG: hypothetical protein ACYDHZ_06415 [Dehalococcoidia bacterium]|jgi:hypothetical protein
MVIRDQRFEKIAENVKPDAKRRVVLHTIHVREGVTYHIYENSLGQIVLDPQVSIPAYEAWLYENPEALSLVRQGLNDVKEGRVSRIDLNSL